MAQDAAPGAFDLPESVPFASTLDLIDEMLALASGR